MKQILSIVNYTVRQNIRTKVYYILIIFAVVLIFVSMLLSVLGGEVPQRILLDFGLTSTEFFALLLVIFSGVNLILEEIDSKTIYLILTRPIPKWYYVVGRYLGMMLSVCLAMLVMYSIHLILLFYKGWIFDVNYLFSVFSSILKIAIVGSLAVLFSLFSTSTAASLGFTFSLWILGHFAKEIDFLIKRLPSTLTQNIVRIFYFLIPNLQYFNLRDYLGSGVTMYQFFGVSVVYALTYSITCLCLAIILFNRKEM